MDASAARILEIGDYSYFKTTYPDRTTLLWTGARPAPVAGAADCTPGRFAKAMRDLRAGHYDLVVAYLALRPARLPRAWARSVARTPWRAYSSFTRVFGVSWLRFVSIPVPLIALDMNDHFGIGRHNFFLLDKADAVFKRELPADRWRLLTHSAHPVLPTRRIRRNARWQARLEKIQPIALPQEPIDATSLWEGDFPEKTSDLFFSGNVSENSWVRRSGLRELEQLAARGVRVDMPGTTLPREEFHRRLSQAWLAWSPEGYGWECYRTAEAAQCLAVPVVNHPTIERHRPLLDGEHLFQYNVEPGGLQRAVETALSDKDRLHKMALAARNHVLAHHTQPALLDHIIETALSRNRDRIADHGARRDDG
jgi:hypothetical protein